MEKIKALVLIHRTLGEPRRYTARVQRGSKVLYRGPLRQYEDTARAEARLKKLELEKQTP